VALLSAVHVCMYMHGICRDGGTCANEVVVSEHIEGWVSEGSR
jgi:hypothetical protein